MTEASDPTGRGFTPPGTPKAQLSANEVEMLALKAARGAEMDWGLAEEAGHAARWLHMRGVDGLALLLDLLHGITIDGHGRPTSHHCCMEDGTRLCPIATGATLSDFDAIPTGPVGPVAVPVLLLPFVARLAESHDMALDVSAFAVVAPDGMLTLTALPVEGPIRIRAAESRTDKGATLPCPSYRRDTLTQLDRYALLTTVPATAASRADAGSDGDDND